MRWYVELILDSLWESVIFSVGCAAAAVAGMVIFQVPFADGLGFVLLVVSAGLMLIGGAMSFVSPGNVKVVNALFRAKLNPTLEDFRKSRHRAALYALTGVLLFVYSLVMASVLV
ncbi:MAG: hypothetical protein JRN08_06135 [Nitrososphaerota archaeon]|nr:hypothetical protein [Nitrososphaerota archaeon]